MRKVVATFLFCLLVLATGCGDDTTSSQGERSSLSKADEIVVGIGQEPDSLDPLFGEMMAGTEIRGAIFRSLVMRDDSLKLRSVMAEEIPTLKNRGIELLPGGKMKTTWKIKKGFKWEDGTPVTAEDFIFAHRAIMADGMPVRPTLTPWLSRGRSDSPGPTTTFIFPFPNTSSNPF
jgi:peptide/nickel transport system substrate-binding protein